eukprot:scaffold66294_cov62-Phaeocystis_antarctica.AAC.3
MHINSSGVFTQNGVYGFSLVPSNAHSARRLRFGAGSLDGSPPSTARCWAPSLALATAVAATRSMSSSCSCMRRFRLRFWMSTLGWSGSRVSGLKPLPSRSTERMADRSYEWPSDATTGSA